MNYIQYMKPGSKFWTLPNGLEDVSWSEFWSNWKKAIAKAKEQIVDNWENLKQDYKDAADPIAASERKQAESIEATRAKQASMKFVSDNRTDHEKKRDRKNFELKEFEQKEQLNKDATDAVMWTLTGPVYAVLHLASPNGVIKTYGNTKAAVQSGGGPYIEKAVASAAGDVLDASIVGVPLWNAARPYAAGLYNTTNYSSLGNRLAHPIESLRFAKINTKLSDLVRQAYPEETAKLMLEEAAPLFKTVRYYNKGTSGPLYIGGTDIPLLIEGLRNTPTTTVKMWDRAHEYGHLFDDALRRLDTGMARGSFGLSKEGISLVPKNYIYSPGVGINTPRGQMEFMADNIASSLYPEPKYVGMLHGEVAPYLERLALAAQVPFGSMYVLNGRAHVPYFLPEYKNFGRFIPTSTLRGSLGKGQKFNAVDDHSILLDTEIKPQIIPTKTSLAFFERLPAKISEAERLGIPKGVRNNKNIVREVPDSQLDDKIWVLKDGTYLEGTFRDIKPGQLFKYDPQDAVSYTYTNGPDKNPLNPDRYLLSDGEFLGFDYMSEYSGHGVLKKDSYIYDHIKMQSNSLLHDKLKAIAANIQISPELYALFLNPRYIQSFKQYYLNKGWRVGNLTDEEIAKIIAYNHKLLTSNLTGVAKDVILWNGSGKQTTADGTVVREAAPDNFKIITENLQGGEGDIRGVWFGDFKDALSYGYPKQIGGSRQRTWEGVLLVDILPYLINDARGHMHAGYKFDRHVAPKNLILHSRELVSGDLDNIKGLFPHPELILLEGNDFTRSWSTKGLHYKKGGSIHIKKENRGKFTDYCDGKVTEECIRKGKNSSNPTTRKRANFAWVARHKFKHEEGGKLNYLNYFQHE